MKHLQTKKPANRILILSYQGYSRKHLYIIKIFLAPFLATKQKLYRDSRALKPTSFDKDNRFMLVLNI